MNRGHDVDTKLCPDCNAQVAKKLIKWPQIFEAYWCKRCQMDFFIDQVKIIPRKCIFVGLDEKGKPKFRVVPLYAHTPK